MNTEQHYTLAFRTAVIAGLFAAVVAALLLIDLQGRVAKEPLNSPAYLALRAQLAKQRQNEELKQHMRDEDLLLREKYFRQRRFTQWGVWLLLSGAVLALVCAKWAATRHRKLPHPAPQTATSDTELLGQRFARWAVGGLALVTAGTIVVLAIGSPRVVPRTPAEVAALAPSSGDLQPGPEPPADQPQPRPPDQPTEKKVPAPDGGDTQSPPPKKTPDKPEAKPDDLAMAKQEPTAKPGPEPQPAAPDAPPLPPGVPTDEELRKNWPSFRGPGGSGVSAFDNIPTKWDVASGEGILWKTKVALPGNSSPIVWDKHVFLTGATKDQRQVFCFDADTGELKWQKDAPSTPDSASAVLKLNQQTGYAASTPATDGRRVYAIFANGDIAALDFAGNVRWARSLGVPKNAYGHASSLAIYRDLVIVQMDQATKVDKLSKLLALRADTGQTAWETPRDVPNSWPSPIVIQHEGQALIITAASPWVNAYSAADGKELWRADRLRSDVGPSPVYANGMIYVANEFPAGSAIRLGGSGDVTKSHLAFEVESNLPDCASPAVSDKYLFVLASSGILTCYNALEGGDPLWDKEFDNANFASSPGQVGKRLYLFAEKGDAWVVEPADDGCQIVAQSKLGEECVASPAFQNGRLYIRGKEHLFCIGK